MNFNDLISVIMPVYNAEKFVRSAIQSILNQTYENFELIVIDDGSTDKSLEIIRSFNDPRIFVTSRENKGLIKSLNEAISYCKGDYIARMDADDISDCNRLMLQLNYFKRHKGVAVVGSYIECIDVFDRHIYFRKTPNSNYVLKGICLFGVPFAHPSVMINYKLINEHYYYDENYLHAEDYELWLRLSKNYTFGMVPKFLLKYRVFESSVSGKNKALQADMHNKIAYKYFAKDKNKVSFDLFQKVYTDCKFFDFLLFIIFNQHSYRNIPFHVFYISWKLLKLRFSKNV